MVRSRFEPSARTLDWTLFLVVALEAATGLVSLVSGRPSDAIVFTVHGVGGFVLTVLVLWKLRRVAPRVKSQVAGTRTTAFSLLLTVVTLAALATGIFWVFGGDFRFLLWNALNVHVALGLLLVPILLLHLRSHFHRPRQTDFTSRRTALQYGALLVFGALVWRVQQATNRLLSLPGASRRFTGSRERGSLAGNAFPLTSWVADDPDPIDIDAWTLSVTGLVGTPRTLAYDELTLDAETRAVLDCTSGWYSDHDWQGVRVGSLLDLAESGQNARWVSFHSVTGYRWSLPIAEARDALLATHVDGEPLAHGHGAPLRLVAPGRRGFQWVKWVTAVEVRETRDVSEWLAIFVSGFTDAPRE
ncbi:molybdopterin-dependent oxidoreductase [Haladaptatus sp. DYSN1]|uniref:molybdopterin-dependent oxidoreductase n=1 Tax=unclassified Haladaptatus TaxID=2622732 RepID=UPI0024073452|nr:molybdopterin-dependent oxidoreductase [Haladaptatus sp. DYSN1]